MGSEMCIRDRPVPPSLDGAAAGAAARRALRPRADWAELERRYATERCVVIDDLLSPEALAELQQYARPRNWWEAPSTLS